MTRSRRWRSVLLLALVAGLIVASPDAALSIVWRTSLLSFDDPASQVLDDLTCQKTSHADPLLELNRALKAAASSSAGFCAVTQSTRRQTSSLGCIEARAPPSV